MEELIIETDFTGVTAATGNKIGVLSPGLHTATLDNFKHFTDSGSVLYCYMETDGVHHRERFNMDNETAWRYLKSFLLSAGYPEKKLDAREKVPYHKLVGKTVRFNYTPPQLDEDGQAVKGTYAKYIFYNKKRFEKLSKYAKPVKASSEASTSAASGSDDFDFLLDE